MITLAVVAKSTIPFLSIAALVETLKTVMDTLVLNESKLGVRSMYGGSPPP